MPIHDSASPSGATESAQRLINEEKKQYLAQVLQWKYEQNSVTPICQLPVEILCRIFLATRYTYEAEAEQGPMISNKRLPYQFLWLVITHVCRLWRTAAINEPSLWTLPTIFHPKLTELMLQRSRMAGLTIEIDHTFSDYPLEFTSHIMDLVLEHMHHVKTLNVLTSVSPTKGYGDLFFQLPGKAPMLEHLTLVHDEPNIAGILALQAGHIAIMPSTVFQEVTTLRTLTLIKIGVENWDSPLFDHLTMLSLSNLPQQHRPTVVQLKAMLARMPRLTLLSLDDACPSESLPDEQEPGISSSEGSKVHLAHLKKLWIGTSASQVSTFFSCIAIPDKLEYIETNLAYRPDIDFIEMFSVANRIHLFDVSSAYQMHLTIEEKLSGVQCDISMSEEYWDSEQQDPEEQGSAELLIKKGWVNYSSTRAVTANRHIFKGIMQGLDWTNLDSLGLDYGDLTPEILKATVGTLPYLKTVILGGRGAAVPFIHALHSGWDVDPSIDREPFAFPSLEVIGFLEAKFSLGDEDALDLGLLQDCLMGRVERGAAITDLEIVLCEGIREADVYELWDIVPSVRWDGEEIGCSDSDDELTE